LLLWQEISNRNEKIAYLRSSAINSLILETSDIFIRNIPEILKGNFNSTLIEDLKESCFAFIDIEVLLSEIKKCKGGF